MTRKNFGALFFKRALALLDDQPNVPVIVGLPVDHGAIQLWGAAVADLLLELRYERSDTIYERASEVVKLVEHLIQSLTVIADFLYEEGDSGHRKMDEALAEAHWHLLSGSEDTVAADRHYRRAGAVVGNLSALARSQGMTVVRFAKAEHFMDGVGVNQDIPKARRLFSGIDDVFDKEPDEPNREAVRLFACSFLISNDGEEILEQAHRIAMLTWRAGFLPSSATVARFEQLRGVQCDDLDEEDEDEVSGKPEEMKESNGGDLIEELAKLDAMVGLASVKEQVRRLIAFESVQALRRKRGLSVSQGPSRHLVLTGSPGTGKTTVARLLARIFHLLGVLESDTFIETTRSGLVGGYLGQTALKTMEVIESARGGMLFIDEAYALSSEMDDSYGSEAINTLLKAMEDYRSELVVVVAGYTNEMEHFLESNPGMRSRFNTTIAFADYSPDERIQILQLCAKAGDYFIDEEALHLAKAYFKATMSRREATGNGRFVRSFYEACVDQQSIRIDEIAKHGKHITTRALRLLTAEDIRRVAGLHDAKLLEDPVPASFRKNVKQGNSTRTVLSGFTGPLMPHYLKHYSLGVNW